MKQPLIVANWKMNTLLEEAFTLMDQLFVDIESGKSIYVAPPFTHIYPLKTRYLDRIIPGAQNCHEFASGAHTGELSCDILKSSGAEFVIIGHSEIRQSNPMEDLRISKKINAACHANMNFIYCCGEPISTRDSGDHIDYVMQQLKRDFEHFKEDKRFEFAIAYEPIWAIGTGRSANSEQIEEMHYQIRDWLKQNFSEARASDIPILYGGSVKANNAGQIAKIPNVNGALVGGASLNPKEYLQILDSFV